MTVVHARTLATPVPRNASFGYGSAMIRVPETTRVLWSWIEGTRKHRLVSWDIASGEWAAIPTPGLLRSAVFERDRAWLLTTQGLHCIRTAPLETLETRTDGIPEWCLGMARIPDSRDVLVWKRKGRTCLRVSLDAGRAIRRIGKPAPTLVTNEGIALSFEHGIGFHVTDPRTTFEIPLASAAIEHRGRMFVTAGERGPAKNVSPEMETENVFDVHDEGIVSEFTLKRGLGKTCVDVGESVRALEGPTHQGHLIARTDESLVWIDPAKGRVLGTTKLHPRPVCVVDDVVIVPPGDVAQEASLFTVNATARDRMKAFVAPVPLAKTPSRTRPAAPGAIANQFFDRVRVSGSLGPAVFQSCEFRHCTLEGNRAPTEVRDVSFERCTFDKCHVFGSRLVDCRIEHAKLSGGWMSLEGVDLLRVVLSGRIDGTLVVQQIPATTLARTGPDEWALDISRAEFSGFELREMPSRLVRRNPEVHVVVRKQKALDRRWEKLSIGHYSITLEDLVEDDVEDVVLIARQRHPKFAEELAALRLLRREGIAEPD